MMARRSEGTVFQRHDHPSCPKPHNGTRPAHRCYGHWVAAVTLPEGKRVVRYRRTRREALDELRRMLAERDGGSLRADRLTVGEWCETWYRTTASTRVRESTLRGYRSKLDNYVLPAIGKKRLTRLTPTDLEQMYAGMIERGLSPRTVAQTHAVLHHALGKALRQGLVASNVAELADKPPVRRTPPTVFDPQAVRAILAAAKGDPLEARWWVALTLGLRQGEALGLTWDDIDLDRGEVTVRHALQRGKNGLSHVPPKSAAGYRTIPMSPQMVAVMRKRRTEQDRQRDHAGSLWADQMGLAFTHDDGRPVTPEWDNRAWHSLLDRAGQPSVRLHEARHTAITIWLLSGVDIHTARKWAGHSSIQITSDTYGGFVAEMSERGMKALEGIYSDERAQMPSA